MQDVSQADSREKVLLHADLSEVWQSESGNPIKTSQVCLVQTCVINHNASFSHTLIVGGKSLLSYKFFAKF